MPRVILIDDGNVEIFSSPESLCSYIEAPSFNGTERAIQEDGMIVELFMDKGAWTRGILGKKVFLADFEYVNFRVIESDEVREEILQDVIQWVKSSGENVDESIEVTSLFNLIEKVVGLN